MLMGDPVGCSDEVWVLFDAAGGLIQTEALQSVLAGQLSYPNWLFKQLFGIIVVSLIRD